MRLVGALVMLSLLSVSAAAPGLSYAVLTPHVPAAPPAFVRLGSAATELVLFDNVMMTASQTAVTSPFALPDTTWGRMTLHMTFAPVASDQARSHPFALGIDGIGLIMGRSSTEFFTLAQDVTEHGTLFTEGEHTATLVFDPWSAPHRVTVKLTLHPGVVIQPQARVVPVVFAGTLVPDGRIVPRHEFPVAFPTDLSSATIVVAIVRAGDEVVPTASAPASVHLMVGGEAIGVAKLVPQAVAPVLLPWSQLPAACTLSPYGIAPRVCSDTVGREAEGTARWAALGIGASLIGAAGLPSGLGEHVTYRGEVPTAELARLVGTNTVGIHIEAPEDPSAWLTSVHFLTQSEL